MGATEMFFVDGELSAQITELAQFIGALKQVGDADKFAADLSTSSDPVQALVAESQGVLAKAPEDKVEAAYNQLFALAASAESAGIDAIAKNVSEDVAAHADSGVAGLRVLNNLYNLADSSRAQVFSSMIVLAVRTHMLATLVPQISQLPKLLSEWSASSDEKADVVVALRNALDAEQLGNEAYEAELAFLEAVGAANAQSVAVATSAIVRFANLSAVCDIDALASLDSVQELSKGGKLGPAGDLLNALLTFDFKQWSQFAADKAALLSELGVDSDKAGDKMRLLTVASIAADNLGQDVPFSQVSQAIAVDEEDVEMWIIDVIRSGLMQGKMNQVSRTLVPTRSTYRTFGAQQWQLLAERLDQWKSSLESLQPVINNAKLVAQQQALQMAGQSRVTIKD
ncbi:hypothetical protein H4R23_004324 [Coemansia sp. Cherry 401B]|nr:hypothetical protein IWW52_004434 [Coemansia sp. RSA 2704]KAJ2723815.1 hypothetical protein H4R23_004324 [Coemansia sp. Cherry 401B]